MNTRHPHADLIHAWAEGATIQCRSDPDAEWCDVVGAPVWLKATDYRVKPKTVTGKFRVGLVKSSLNDEIFVCLYEDTKVEPAEVAHLSLIHI